MCRMSALKAHVAQGVAEGVAMKMFSLLAGKGWKDIPLTGRPGEHLTKQCDGLPRQRDDVRPPHFHLATGNRPFGGVKVELCPFSRSNQGGWVRGQHRQNECVASNRYRPFVDGFD